MVDSTSVAVEGQRSSSLERWQQEGGDTVARIAFGSWSSGVGEDAENCICVSVGEVEDNVSRSNFGNEQSCRKKLKSF